MSEPFDDLGAFALDRVSMDAMKLGDSVIPAIDYTWAISDDGGESYRNPTNEDKMDLYSAVRTLCRDCGDAGEGKSDPVGFDCGHIAHEECHVHEGTLSCRYAGTADSSIRIKLEEQG